MKYKEIVQGIFIERLNRFVAKVEINNSIELVHVKNTGRCRELLLPKATVYLEYINDSNRKTKYDLIAVEKIKVNGEILLINMDSQVPNVVALDYLKKSNLFSKTATFKREVTYKNSRFDIFIEDLANSKKAFVEVKGVTLEDNGIVKFPDAPTERGVKHINELVASLKDGFEAYIFFVIQMKNVNAFMPNDLMHKEFGQALRNAVNKGVKVIAMDCVVTSNSIQVDKDVKVIL